MPSQPTGSRAFLLAKGGHQHCVDLRLARLNRTLARKEPRPAFSGNGKATRLTETMNLLQRHAGLRIVRIRRHSARQGGLYYYYHADIIVPTVEAAIEAVTEGRVKNWRYRDDFNPGQPETFLHYEVLDPDLHPALAENDQEPRPANPAHRWHPAEVRKSPDYVYAETYYCPKVRNKELEAKLRHEEKLSAAIEAAATESSARPAAADQAFLVAFAERFRKEQGLTGHRRTQCEKFATRAFQVLRDALRLLPKRDRTKAGLARLVEYYHHLSATLAVTASKPLAHIEGNLRATLAREPEFLARLTQALKT